ncbi:hypothetical protein EH223_12480 [candidate division KSB1 bacterium]|nr:hypothetical protein [candidate division KSB1 bacterium]RQW02444.1 MAG: hypothetical protein EH223_12480 [candidate division KSB1 bacterium]
MVAPPQPHSHPPDARKRGTPPLRNRTRSERRISFTARRPALCKTYRPQVLTDHSSVLPKALCSPASTHTIIRQSPCTIVLTHLAPKMGTVLPGNYFFFR